MSKHVTRRGARCRKSLGVSLGAVALVGSLLCGATAAWAAPADEGPALSCPAGATLDAGEACSAPLPGFGTLDGALLADSQDDYSTAPDERWHYGYYPSAADCAAFEALPAPGSDGSWHGSQQHGTPSVGQTAMRPGFDDGAWAVRRLTVNFSGRVRVSGTYWDGEPTSYGNMNVRVMHNCVEVYAARSVPLEPVSYALPLDVRSGDVLDFIVASGSTPGGEATHLTASVRADTELIAAGFAGPVKVDEDPPPGTEVGPGTTEVTLTASDDFGHSAQCGVRVEVVDTLAPSMQCPAEVVVELGEACEAPLGSMAPLIKVADHCAPGTFVVAPSLLPEITLDQAPPWGTLLGLEPAVDAVTMTATDASGNNETCEISVRVEDTAPPAVVAPLPFEGECTGAVPDPDESGWPTADDSCGLSYPAPKQLWINEIGYDNIGQDQGEFVEVGGTAGADLSPCRLVLYNGATLRAYDTVPLGGVIDDEGCGFGALAFAPPTRLQNGPRDGVALVCSDDSGADAVVQFLSYEGTLTPKDGPAAGMTSVELPVTEGSRSPVGQTLQLTGGGRSYDDFVWTGPVDESPHRLNAGQQIALCGGELTVTWEDSALSSGCPKQLTRTFYVADPAGNVTPVTQDITLVDTQAPEAFAAENVTVQCDQGLDPSDTGLATCWDQCQGDAIAPVYIDTPRYNGACEDEFSFLRIAICADDCQQVDSAVQFVNVVDEGPPSLADLPNQVFDCSQREDSSLIVAPPCGDSCDPSPSVASQVTESAIPPSATLRHLQSLRVDHTGGVWYTHAQSVVISPDGRFVYATTAFEDGEIAIYARDEVSGALTEIGRAATPTWPGCVETIGMLAITHHDGGEFVVAVRDRGYLNVYRRDITSGALTRLSESACSGYPSGSYPWAVQISPDDRHVIVANMGEEAAEATGDVSVFALDTADGTLTEVVSDAPSGRWAAGRRPSELAFSGDDGQFVLVANSSGHDVTVFERDLDSGVLTKVPSDEDDGNFSAGLGAAAIAVHDAADPLVVVSNYDEGTLTVFRQDGQSGALRRLDASTVTGNTPVAANIGVPIFTADGESLIVGTWDATWLFSVDDATGALTQMPLGLGDGSIPAGSTDLVVSADGRYAYSVNSMAISTFELTPRQTSAQELMRTIDWECSDRCGNTTSSRQLLFYTDEHAPEIIAPADVTLECGSSTDTTVTGEPIVSDGCDEAPTITQTDEILGGPCPSSAVINRAFVACDGSGNCSAPVYQQITIEDSTPPTTEDLPNKVFTCSQRNDMELMVPPPCSDSCDAAAAVTRQVSERAIPAGMALDHLESLRVDHTGGIVYSLAYSVVISPDGRFVYATTALEDGEIAIYARDEVSGALTEIGRAATPTWPGCVSEGMGMLAITHHDGGEFVVAVRYGGYLNVYRRDITSGALTRLSESACSGYPSGSYPWAVQISPDDRHVIVANMGEEAAEATGDLSVFALDAADGTLTEVVSDAPSGRWAAGRRPSELAFSGDDGQFVLVANWRGHDVTVFERDLDSGALTKVSSDEDDGNFSAGLGAAAIAVHDAADPLVVVSNYDEGTLTVFRQDGQSGVLRRLDAPTVTGNTPVAANIGVPIFTADGESLIVGTWDATWLFSVDDATGALTQMPLGLGDGSIPAGSVDLVVSPDGRQVYSVDTTNISSFELAPRQTCSQELMRTVDWVCSDSCGNPATTQQTYYYVDRDPPTLAFHPDGTPETADTCDEDVALNCEDVGGGDRFLYVGTDEMGLDGADGSGFLAALDGSGSQELEDFEGIPVGEVAGSTLTIVGTDANVTIEHWDDAEDGVKRRFEVVDDVAQDDAHGDGHGVDEHWGSTKSPNMFVFTFAPPVSHFGVDTLDLESYEDGVLAVLRVYGSGGDEIAHEELVFEDGDGDDEVHFVGVAYGSPVVGKVTISVGDNVPGGDAFDEHLAFDNLRFGMAAAGGPLVRTCTATDACGNSVTAVHTVPLGLDSDQDGLPDAWEIGNGLDPSDDGTTDPDQGALGDPDADGLTNIGEYTASTLPRVFDTDDDGLGDGDELTRGCDPVTAEANHAPYNLRYPLRDGYVMPGASRVDEGYLFSLWTEAGSPESVEVVGTFNGWEGGEQAAMRRDACQGYWWKLLPAGAGASEVLAGARYKFRLSGDTWTGDPYARSVDASDNDNSIVLDASSYAWNDAGWQRPDKARTVIYEASVADLTFGHPDVSAEDWGRFGGLVDPDVLAYLVDLGVNVVELMPVSDWPGTGYSWGYNPCSYFAPENGLGPDPSDGSAYDAFKAVVDALHQNGIAVVLDVVYNHVSDQQDPGAGLHCEWRDVPALSAYFDSEPTAWGPRLDWSQWATQKLFTDNLIYWMDELHVDGFRFDATGEITAFAQFLDVIEGLADGGYGDRYYLLEEWDDSHLQQLQERNAARGDDLFTGWSDRFKRAVWDATCDDDSDELGVVTYYSKDHGWTTPGQIVNYFSSHDEGTLAGGQYDATGQTLERCAATTHQTQTAAVHLLTAMGTPMWWMGEEFGRLHHGNHPPLPDTNGTSEANNRPIAWSLAADNAPLVAFFGELTRLRLAHPALGLDVADPDAVDYFNWLTDWDGRFVGYSYHDVPCDNDFVVLVNYGSTTKYYEVDFPHAGLWYVMSDGRRARSEAPGLSARDVGADAIPMQIAPNTGLVFMSAALNPSGPMAPNGEVPSLCAQVPLETWSPGPTP